MPLSNWFWIFMVIYIGLAIWRDYAPDRPWYRWGIAIFVQIILFAIVGWAIFQGPVK